MQSGSTAVVAVSGGSDSLSLLFWADAQVRRRHIKLHIVTLDHRLRTEAKAEADYVLELGQSLGHSAERLIWQHPKPTQNAARAWRHHSLAGVAKSVGATTILLGHTFDDVVETFMMRRRRHRHSPRLAGPLLLSPHPFWPQGRGVSLFRPLLFQRREMLQHLLRAKGATWFEDPSNHAQKYERSRVRTFLKSHPRLSDIVDVAVERAVIQRHHFDYQIGVHLSDGERVRVGEDGLVQAMMIDLTNDVHTAALAVLIRIASGGDKQLSIGAVRRALGPLTKRGDRITLGGAWLQKAAQGFLVGRTPSGGAARREPPLWDGRYERSAAALLPDYSHHLLRGMAPPDRNWRPLMAERLLFEANLMARLTERFVRSWQGPIEFDSEGALTG